MLPIPLQLQTQYRFFEEQDSSTILIGVVVIVVFIILLAAASRLSSGAGAAGTKGSKFSFRRRARSLGLTKPQILAIERLAGVYRIVRPERLLESPALLDNVLRKEVQAIEADVKLGASEQDRRKAVLFLLRQQIDRASDRKIRISSTHEIRPNQELQFVTADRVRYTGYVRRIEQGSILTEMPRSEVGTEVRFRKGTALGVRFSQNGRDMYSFETRVLGYRIGRGNPVLILQHSPRVTHTQKRRYRRREVLRPAYFYPVMVVESETKGSKQAVVETRKKATGTLVDISAGGCAIKTAVPLAKGRLLKLEFNIRSGRDVAVFGKIIQVQGVRPRGAVMHIMFTNISRRNFNLIQEYVYGFTSE